MSALASLDRSPWWRGRRLAGLLIMIGGLMTLGAIVAVQLTGDRPAPPYSLLALTRLASHFALFVGGAALLISSDAVLQAPFRQRFAYVLLAAGAWDVLSYLFH